MWARNLTTKQVNAFIVRKGTPGFKTTKIENKISLRCTQNADIEMRDVFVPDCARLPGVNSFQVSVRTVTLLLLYCCILSPVTLQLL